MILQGPSDSRNIGDDGDAMRAEMFRAPDSRKHEQSWRVDGAGAQHDLARRVRAQELGPAIAQVLDAHRAAFLDEQARYASAGMDLEIRPRDRWSQERRGRAMPSSVQNVSLIEPRDAGRIGHIEVVRGVGWKALLHRRGKECAVTRVRIAAAADRESPISAAVR
jgi:hypothetical protein